MSPRARVLAVTVLIGGGCVVNNPAFDPLGEGAGETTASSTTGGTTGVGPTTGAEPGGSSGPAGTGTGGASEGTSEGSGAVEPGPTTGGSTGPAAPETAELRHYADLAECDFPFWCAINGDVNNPSSAENWAAECFDAPLEPPFVVSRVGFAVFGSQGGPGAVLEFHAYDGGAQRPVVDPFAAVDLGVIDSPGYRSFPLDPPVLVEVQRFCVSVHSGAQFGPQLGLALDDALAPAGQTFVGIKGPLGCDVSKFTDLSGLGNSSRTQWCIDATVAGVP